MRGHIGGVKGVPVYKKLTLNHRAVRAYYFIQEFIKQNGRGPTYYEIGSLFGGSENYYTTRNKGIKVCKQLEGNGFIIRVGTGRGSIHLTEKPFTEVNIVIPTDAKTHERKD